MPSQFHNTKYDIMRKS